MQAIVPNSYDQRVAALIKPFPKSGNAKYRLLMETGGRQDTLNERNEIIPSQSFGQPTEMTAQAVIYDPYQEQSVTINVSSAQRIQGQGANQYLAPVLEHIRWNRLAETEVTPQQMARYRFLELHPGNRNNPLTGIDAKDSEGRKTTAMPPNGWLFERIEPAKTARELAEQQRLTDKIRGIIGSNTHAENLAIATRLPAYLKFDLNQTEDGLYSQLRAAAEKDPDAVFRATTDEAGRLEALVNEALAYKLIEFDHVSRTYLTSATRRTLVAVPAGEPKEGFIAWLHDTQGAATRGWLKTAVAEAKGPQKEETTKRKGIKVAPGQPVPEGYDPKPGKLGYHYPLEETE